MPNLRTELTPSAGAIEEHTVYAAPQISPERNPMCRFARRFPAKNQQERMQENGDKKPARQPACSSSPVAQEVQK
jgi:hypothetical protein